MKPRLLLILSIIFATLCGCSEKQDASQRLSADVVKTPIAAPKVVAKFNGGLITDSDLADAEEFWYSMSMDRSSPQTAIPPTDSSDLIRMVAAQSVLAKRARENGLNESPVFLEMSKRAASRLVVMAYRQKQAQDVSQDEAMA
ncbi:MAG TPA: hypothetical protein PKH07_11350, partial [bacterium]|nr:hypothetical protein [bacterium]